MDRTTCDLNTATSAGRLGSEQTRPKTTNEPPHDRDAITPNQDFIVSPHLHAKNLYLATGGSFHSFKFLLTLGDFIASMMDGTLEKDLAERWAWDRAKEECSNKRMMPAKDMAELKL